MNKREEMEIMIGRQVAESIAAGFVGKEIDVKDIMACYVMSVGATMSIIYEDATASKVKEACGEWGKRGFTEAKSMTFR